MYCASHWETITVRLEATPTGRPDLAPGVGGPTRITRSDVKTVLVTVLGVGAPKRPLLTVAMTLM